MSERKMPKPKSKSIRVQSFVETFLIWYVGQKLRRDAKAYVLKGHIDSTFDCKNISKKTE